MIAYQMVGTNDLERAKGFYDEVLGVIGAVRGMETRKGQAYNFGAGPMFVVTTPNDDADACVGNGVMTAFSTSSADEVTQMHAKACQLGGECEGPPGDRQFGYFAYFRDLDGNKLCACYLG